MTGSLSLPAATDLAAAIDPREARAQFLFDLDMAEINVVIPQAEAIRPIQRF